MLTNEIDVSVVCVGWPVLAKVVEELGPRCEIVSFKVGDRERESVVDPGDEASARSGLLDKPFGDFPPSSVPLLTFGGCG